MDPLARDHAARDFRRYLQVEKRAAASRFNLGLGSLDALSTAPAEVERVIDCACHL
jgi:hypothetical protein